MKKKEKKKNSGRIDFCGEVECHNHRRCATHNHTLTSTQASIVYNSHTGDGDGGGRQIKKKEKKNNIPNAVQSGDEPNRIILFLCSTI